MFIGKEAGQISTGAVTGSGFAVRRWQYADTVNDSFRSVGRRDRPYAVDAPGFYLAIAGDMFYPGSGGDIPQIQLVGEHAAAIG